ncbi:MULTISPECIES: ABC transporter permease [Streptomyces]|uniref:ABC transporter permease n=1 Tax=Streptomyces TaxID=1883 RepID=UPI00240D35C2|nr:MULTISPECIES: ABC transporter permease [Streptomyces]WFB82449.1 ABC transporter permease [Streptomyces olivaceus]WGK44785.1 ABC transporter permease [Streptomyces sp. B146]
MAHLSEDDAGAGPPLRGHRWAAFRQTPFWPATVLMLILAAAAGLFAGSYTYSMANPTPRLIPTAVVGQYEQDRGRAFLAGLEKALDTSVRVHPYRTRTAAHEAIEQQEVFAVFELRDDGRNAVLDVSGASGASVAELLTKTAPAVGEKLGVHVTVHDVNPLQEGDPRGLAIFYVSLAAVIIGFVGAIQLSVHARSLTPVERILFTAAYALLGGFAIAATVDWLLGALDLPFAESWSILALTMFVSGMVFTMFNTLFGRWAMLPTWGLMVIIGNPSSGGAVSWPLLPSPLGLIGRWLPPGASVNAQHTAVYFQGHQHVFPFLVLGGWALLSCTVFWVWRHRHPGGREKSAVTAEEP